MDDPKPTTATHGETGGITPAITAACAVACGVMVANIYYAQPLIGLIAPALKLGTGAAGLIVTLTQLGYAGGLLLALLAWVVCPSSRLRIPALRHASPSRHARRVFGAP